MASADIYVIADLGEPGTSIESNDPQWDVTLYNRYTGVIDALHKYKNVLGFFAGNENVSAGNQTAAAAFVKAAVRDTKGYIKSQGYRSTLGVGYATADVPTRDELAYYFACEPDSTNSTQIDFWGYNVYSWCGDSNYAASSYGERVDFFSSYPVPAFFAEYGCIVGISGGATHRPFTEVEVLYGNMTSVFSGGIVYEWFMGANEYGLVELTSNDASVSPYPDFTSLRSQLATVSPSSVTRSAYTPSNSAPACPTVGSSWAAEASPLPPAPNAQLCSCMLSTLQCTIESLDSAAYEGAFNYICAANDDYCVAIAHNATTGDYGGYSGCDPKDQLAWVANQYYLGNGKSSSACNFDGLATIQTASTASGCASLLSAVGSGGTGTVASPTAKATSVNSGTATSSKGGAGSVGAPGLFEYGGVVLGMYVLMAGGSLVGMLAL